MSLPFFIPKDITVKDLPTPGTTNYPDTTNSVMFDTAIGTGDVTVTDGTDLLTGNLNTRPGISNYQVDYILVVLDDYIKREITKNPDVIFDTTFQEYIQWVLEFKRIVLESRADPNSEAMHCG